MRRPVCSPAGPRLSAICVSPISPQYLGGPPVAPPTAANHGPVFKIGGGTKVPRRVRFSSASAKAPAYEHRARRRGVDARQGFHDESRQRPCPGGSLASPFLTASGSSVRAIRGRLRGGRTSPRDSRLSASGAYGYGHPSRWRYCVHSSSVSVRVTRSRASSTNSSIGSRYRETVPSALAVASSRPSGLKSTPWTRW